MVETDSPYLTPAPHRGKKTQPANVVHVGAAVAELHGVSISEVATTTAANADRFYDFPGAKGEVGDDVASGH